MDSRGNSPALMSAKGILIGLGNPIMADDGTGLLVSRAVHKHLVGFDLDLACSSGFDVVDRVLGFDSAVIIDSMVTGRHSPGNVVRLDLEGSEVTLRSRHSHGLGFMEALKMARAVGAAVPRRILVYGIEVVDPFSLGAEVSPAILARVEAAAREISQDVLEGDSGLTCTNSE
jgi:hydrogenase maturation protease